MPENTLPAALVKGIQAGESKAAEILVAHFGDGLRRQATRRLGRKFAIRTDGEEVVQSAFRTFFRRVAEGKLTIDNSNELAHLLVQITQRKALAKIRTHTAQGRSVNAEVPGAECALANVECREQLPDHVVMVEDLCDAIVKGLPSLHRQVLFMQVQGSKIVEIATEVGVSQRTVNRILGILRDRITTLTAD